MISFFVIMKDNLIENETRTQDFIVEFYHLVNVELIDSSIPVFTEKKRKQLTGRCYIYKGFLS